MMANQRIVKAGGGWKPSLRAIFVVCVGSMFFVVNYQYLSALPQAPPATYADPHSAPQGGSAIDDSKLRPSEREQYIAVDDVESLHHMDVPDDADALENRDEVGNDVALHRPGLRLDAREVSFTNSTFSASLSGRSAVSPTAAPRRALEGAAKVDVRAAPKPGKCLSKECLPEVAEADYVAAYSDPQGGEKSMAATRLVNGPLSIRVYVYTAQEVQGIKELTTGSRMSLTVCSIGMWGTQVVMHKFLEASSVRTLDPAEADYFFVPAYPKCVLDREKKTEEEVNRLYIKVIQQLPYFRRSGGRDHMFVFPSGRGATTFTDWKQHIAQSIFLSPEGHFTDNYAAHTPYFSSHKDILIPGRLDDRKNGLMRAAKPQAARTTLGIFYGTTQGKEARRKLMDLGKKYPDIDTKCERDPDYWTKMGNSQFCFAPRGQSSWTLRFYESFYAGCIPVILADSIELPFQDMIDYSRIVIKWPMNRIDGDLVKYLRSVPLEVREEMVRRGEEIRCMFVYNVDASMCNAFTAILWQLQARRRVFQQSREVFWLHDGAIVDRGLQPMASWRAPLPSANIYNAEPSSKCKPACPWGGPNLCKSDANGIFCQGVKSDPGKC